MITVYYDPFVDEDSADLLFCTVQRVPGCDLQVLFNSEEMAWANVPIAVGTFVSTTLLFDFSETCYVAIATFSNKSDYFAWANNLPPELLI